MSLEIQKVDVRGLLEEALESIRVYAESCEVELELELGRDFERGGGARMLADRDRLMQILHTLLSNAIKFSPAGEKVTLGGQRSENRVVLSVKDRGPGIPADFQKRLFEPFSQADASATRRTDGSGLGLSIVKSLVERMAGAVYFESQEGKGSTFFVELPLDPELDQPLGGDT
jgi:signal transduction histidine kinase